jgi:hypothetical protein
MSEEKKAQPKTKAMLAVAIVGAALIGYNLFSGDSAPKTTAPSGPKPIEIGSDPVNSMTVKDKDAALSQFAKKIESQDMKLATYARQQADAKVAAEQNIRAQEQKFNTELRSLSEELAKLKEDQVNRTYKATDNADNGKAGIPPAMPNQLPPLGKDGLNFDNLDFNLSGTPPTAPIQPANPYGPNYFILRPQHTAPLATNKNGGASSASEDDLFTAMGQPAPQPPSNSQYIDTPLGQPGAQQQEPEYANTPKAASVNNAQERQRTQNSYKGVAQNATGNELLETIPAFSYVEVTPLHGVACPIGANSPGNSNATNIPARPVVLPARGIFRGPNGASNDLGTIHLIGLCSGRRTSSSSTGRATIRLEQLSYWDSKGGAQMVPSTGYIVDSRDNEQDVYGRIDKATGRTLALQAASAAAAAYATTLSQAEFTTQRSLTAEGTTSATQQLTGDSSKAAATQGIAAMFTKIGQRFEQEANASVDTIVVEPGIKLRFVTDQPISILKPADAFELNSKADDVLL